MLGKALKPFEERTPPPSSESLGGVVRGEAVFSVVTSAAQLAGARTPMRKEESPTGGRDSLPALRGARLWTRASC
jgi:hypothetical protein